MIFLFFACAHPVDSTVAAVDQRNSGGELTVNDATINAFALPGPNLSSKERRAFAVGNSFFNDNWVTAPSSTEGRDGLGPLFNAPSCSTCHFKDGRGKAPSAGEPMLSMLLRLSVPGNKADGSPEPDPNYGAQLQDKGIQGVAPEAAVDVRWVEEEGSYPDGQKYSLRKPVFVLSEPAYGPFSENLLISPRVAPPVFGTGLLEAISEETLTALSDPEDRDGDGISGKINRLSQGQVGRFGWKASEPSLERQTAGAFLGDIGITSAVNPSHGHPLSQKDLDALPTGGSPELTDHKLQRVVFYCQTLAVPARRQLDKPLVRAGEKLFHDSGCVGCHVPALKTGNSHPVEALRNQHIQPFTDLLLHDMGPGLADERPVFSASGTEWRTPPLWGIGLTETVSGHTQFLHDGRARNLEEAVLWHGGEAAASVDKFKGLSKTDRESVLLFLNSL